MKSRYSIYLEENKKKKLREKYKEKPTMLDDLTLLKRYTYVQWISN